MKSEPPHDSYFLLFAETGAMGFLCFWTPVVYLTGRLLLGCMYSLYDNEKVILSTLGVSLLFPCFSL